jgi:hypothetical protein
MIKIAMKIKRPKFYIVLLAVLVIILIFFYFQNNYLQITNIQIQSPYIRNEVKIIHLSDLHGKEFGRNNNALISSIKDNTPDIIVFTGDLIDKSGNNINGSVLLLSELNKYRPVYYVPGNHEYRSGQSNLVFRLLEENGVKVLRNKMESLNIKNTKISILGIDETVINNNQLNENLNEFEKSNSFKILLSHYPENFSRIYKHRNIDLVLSGHAHGGQFIIPFAGGLYAPGQGFFPKYYKDKYIENGVDLVVSRGLGNSVIPVRIFNRPEIVSISLTQSPTI